MFDTNVKYIGDFIDSNDAQIPCKDTVDICKTASKFVDVLRLEPHVDYNILLKELLLSINMNTLYTGTDFNHNIEHKSFLIRFIAEDFIRTRATYIAIALTLEQQKKFLRKKIFENTTFLWSMIVILTFVEKI